MIHKLCRTSTSVPNAFGIHRNALRMSADLRRDAVSQRVGVKSSVLAQLKPGTVLLSSLRDAIFLTRGEIFPRIVAGDRQERPVGALQMLQQGIADSRVGWTARRFAQHFF